MKHLSQHTGDKYRYTLSCQEYLVKKNIMMKLLILFYFRRAITLLLFRGMVSKSRVLAAGQLVFTYAGRAEMEDRLDQREQGLLLSRTNSRRVNIKHGAD